MSEPSQEAVERWIKRAAVVALCLYHARAVGGWPLVGELSCWLGQLLVLRWYAERYRLEGA